MAHSELLYYNMMTPAWLQDPRNKVDWSNCNDKSFEDLRIVIGPDRLPYEKIFTVSLLDASFFAQSKANSDILVKIVVGLELPDTHEVLDGRIKAVDMPKKPTDPIALLLSDGDKAIGMVIQDVMVDHDIEGPYYGIQADVGPNRLFNVSTDIGKQLTRTSAKNNPDEYRLSLKPSEYWGEAYSAMDGGHKSLVYYNKAINLKRGLQLEVCRVEENGKFKINYIEVTIYKGAASPRK